MRSCGRFRHIIALACLALTLLAAGCSQDLPSADAIIRIISDPDVTSCREWTGEEWRAATAEQQGDAAIYVTFTVIGTAQGVSSGLETEDSFAALESALKDEETRAGFLETAESNETAITRYFDSAPENAVIQDFILYELQIIMEEE